MSLLTSLLPSFQRPLAQRAATPGETDLGPTRRPTYEVQETADGYALTVQLPGVTKDGLELSAEADVITIVGRRSWERPETWTALYRESGDATFVLNLSHDNAVNLDQVRAELRDGVLRVALPKAEAVKPRKIAVA